MISICMATYNGERFIEEQLKCIYEQTLQADEVIICDDNSEDGTRDIIEAYIREHNLQDKWQLFHNSERKGYPDNFYYAMSLAKGDIVFLADQDDLWSEKKLEEMQTIMQRNKQIQVLACKMELIDSQGENIKTLVKPNYSAGTKKVQEIPIEKVLYKNEWSGMVLAYRNRWYQRVGAGVEKTSIPHDLAISLLASAENAMYQLDDILAWHRRHDNNAAGEEHRIARLLNKERKIKDIEKYENYLQEMLRHDIIESEQGRKSILRKQEQMQTRRKLLTEGRCLPVLQNFVKNRKEVRFFTFLCDFLICMR